MISEHLKEHEILGIKGNTDSRYVNISGDTMTGPLIVQGAITGTSLTDGTATLSSGNLTGMGNITGDDVDLSLGTGNITTSGLATVDDILLPNGGTVGTATYKWLFDETNGDITATGNVGIGTTSPEYILDINGGTNDNDSTIRIGNSDDTTILWIAGTRGAYGYNRSANLFTLQAGVGKSLTFNTGASTFGNNERMRITSDGNVGIGETDPETLTEWSSTVPYLTLHNTTEEDTDYGRESRIIAKGEQSGTEETTLGYLEFAHDGTGDDQKGIFTLALNDGTDGDTPTAVMTVDSAGNVGIGTTAPGANLEVGGSANEKLRLVDTNSDGNPFLSFYQSTAERARIQYLDSGDQMYFYSQKKFSFRPQNVEAMVIDDGGNVGIGDTSPSTLTEWSSTVPYLTLHNTTEEDTDYGRESRIIAKGEQSGTEETTLGYLEFAHDGTGDDEKGIFTLKLNDGTDGDTPTSVVTVDSAGNVGIGTTGPGAPLHINSTSGESIALLILESDVSGGGYNEIQSKVVGGLNFGGIRFYAESGAYDSSIRFVTQTASDSLTEQMVIQHDGNVGIGVTDPDTKLEILNGGTQAKLSYDATNYITLATQSDGDLTIDSNKTSYVLDLGDGTIETTGADWVKDTHIDWGTGANQVSAADVPVTILSGATYDDIQNFIDTTQSAGIISGGEVTVNSPEDGMVDVAAGTGMIRSADTTTSPLLFFDWDATENVELTDNVLNYIIMNYHATTPFVSVITSLEDYDKNTQIPIDIVFRKGDEVEIDGSAGMFLPNYKQNMWHRLIHRGIEQINGTALVAESGTRYLTITEGIYYYWVESVVDAIDTTGAGRFKPVYRDGGTGWTYGAEAQQFSNILYDDGDGTPGDIGVAKYATYYVYQCLEGDMYIQYGQGQNNTLTIAQNEDIPSPPNYLDKWATLRAKIIILNGATNATSISNYSSTAFTSYAAGVHSELTGLAWTSSGHTGTATRLAGFEGAGAASEYTMSGTGTEIPTTVSPTFTTPNLGTPSALVGTNISGTGANFTAGTVSTITGLAPDTQNTYARTQYLIPYASSTTAFGEIAIGTDGQVLTSGGAGVAPSFEDAAGGSTATREEVNSLLNAYRIAVNGSLVKFNLMDGIMDEFEDESGVDTGTSTNEDYDSSNDLYSPDVVETKSISQETSNDYVQQGDVGGQERRNAQSFTLSAQKTIDAIGIELDANSGSPSGDVTIRIETDSSNVPSGTLANVNATKAVTVTASQWNKFSFDTPFSLSSGTYWIVFTCADQSNNAYWTWKTSTSSLYAGGNMAYSTDGGSSWTALGTYDQTFRVYTDEPGNMTLVSNSTEAEANPDTVRIVVFEEDVDAITENTDLKAYASRDNGGNWVQATLTDEGDYESGQRLLTGEADVSGQASDKTVKWKVETLNEKDCKIHGIGYLLK